MTLKIKTNAVIQTINNGQVNYDVSKSKTDILSAHIGAVVYFNSLFNWEGRFFTTEEDKI